MTDVPVLTSKDPGKINYINQRYYRAEPVEELLKQARDAFKYYARLKDGEDLVMFNNVDVTLARNLITNIDKFLGDK